MLRCEILEKHGERCACSEVGSDVDVGAKTRPDTLRPDLEIRDRLHMSEAPRQDNTRHPMDNPQHPHQA